ncbi:dihydropteroate synthase [Spirochaetes bacterium]|uniref:dihydropteroate synthase n=1 Tax=Candidatus Scatousia excrementipullorum TaxID=2840936 RepID=A0A9D9DLY8_9BACT|nr:dihydropteroate synthase [Candidatus Scatousia excrementipullorum]
MQDFLLREIITDNILPEIESVGFDSSYSNQVCDKFEYRNIKIYSLTIPQANILKQTALSVGADCATHRETITAKIEMTDCILGGSISQIKKIAEKLKFQPFGLKSLGEKIISFIGVEKKAETKIMGILNLTDNSFSDGGKYLDSEIACEHLLEMIAEGADIIDIGAESTKPYSKAVPEDIQLGRILPVLEFVKSNNIKTPLSIDTRSAVVAEECIKNGAAVINDVSGLTYDDKMAYIVAKYGVKVVIQHSKGTPDVMQNNPVYENLMDEIYRDLKQKTDYAISCGIQKDNIIIDPGIGFGKTREDNFEIIKRIQELYGIGCPVLLGVSRKSLLNMQDEDNFTKDIFTVALNTLALEKKVDIIRVHNVRLHRQLLDMLCKI